MLASTMLQERNFDVILMDMEMPDTDGPTATRMAIRSLTDTKKANIPVIAMTANTGKEDIMRCLDAGMNDYCAKPVDPDDLRALLMRVTKTDGSPKATSLNIVKAQAPKKLVTKVAINPNAEDVHEGSGATALCAQRRGSGTLNAGSDKSRIGKSRTVNTGSTAARRTLRPGNPRHPQGPRQGAVRRTDDRLLRED